MKKSKQRVGVVVEENAPIVFELTGCFIEERFQGLNYHTYIFDLGRPGHLYMSVYDEDVKKIELNEPYRVKVRLFGKYHEDYFGQNRLNNMVKVYDLKKIQNEKGAN